MELDLNQFEGDLQEQLHAFFQEWLDWRELKPEIGQIIRTSIDENFLVEGRWDYGEGGEFTGGSNKWKPSKRAKSGGGVTLTDDGLLAASIDVFWEGDTLVMTSPLKYAAIHHYGGEIDHPGGTPYIPFPEGGGFRRADGTSGQVKFLRKDGSYPVGVKFTKAHVIKIPARPYLVVQEEDYEDIVALFVERGRRIGVNKL